MFREQGKLIPMLKYFLKRVSYGGQSISLGLVNLSWFVCCWRVVIWSWGDCGYRFPPAFMLLSEVLVPPPPPPPPLVPASLDPPLLLLAPNPWGDPSGDSTLGFLYEKSEFNMYFTIFFCQKIYQEYRQWIYISFVGMCEKYEVKVIEKETLASFNVT